MSNFFFIEIGISWSKASVRQYHYCDYYLNFFKLISFVFFQFQAALLQRWHLPAFMCPFCPFVKVVSVTVSVFTLAAIAIDRHRAILTPFT